jgi:hypothetical protein
VLLSLREEWLAHLDRYAPLFPDGVRIRYRLDQLRDEAARKAIVEPAAESGSTILEATMARVADALVANLRRVPVKVSVSDVREVEGEFIEPVHLQVVCRGLWKRIVSDSQPLSDAEMTQLLDVDEALENFYDTALRNTYGPRVWEERALRRWFQNKLITTAGTRGIVYMDDASGKTAGISNAQVDNLERERIIRRELRGGAAWVELTHDRLIGPITRSNETFNRRQTKGATIAVQVAVVASLLGLGYWAASRRDAYFLRVQFASQAQEQLTSESRKKVLDLASAVVDPQETPAAKARALARLALEQSLTGDLDRGADLLRAALLASRPSAEQAIAERLANATPDTNVDLQRVQRQLVQKIGESLSFDDSDPASLRGYVCDHDSVVIGASERNADAPAALKRWVKVYPLAALDDPQKETGYTPVMFDYNVTCDAARKLSAEIENRIHTHPMIRSWFPTLECRPCPGPTS